MTGRASAVRARQDGVHVSARAGTSPERGSGPDGAILMVWGGGLDGPPSPVCPRNRPRCVHLYSVLLLTRSSPGVPHPARPLRAYVGCLEGRLSPIRSAPYIPRSFPQSRGVAGYHRRPEMGPRSVVRHRGSLSDGRCYGGSIPRFRDGPWKWQSHGRRIPLR